MPGHVRGDIRPTARRSARVSGGQLVRRRDLLKAGGLAGLGIAAGPQLAAWLSSSSPTDAADAAAPADDAIGALAAALDYDAERIFRFVTDEIRYEPYSGILRGARVALASRAGNSADQALLLAALLDASLLPVRFAIGEIDGATADTLLSSSEVDADTVRQQTIDALAGAVPEEAPPLPELTPEEQARLDEAAAAGAGVAAWARDRLEHTVETITGALADAGIELADGFTELPDLERTQHVWIQLARTSDWLDLDPTLSGSVPGTAAASPTKTLDALPDEMAHQVELAVIGETLEDDTLTERPLLRFSERADVLAGVPIVISNTTSQALSAIGVSLAGLLGGGASYAPLIVVGEEAAAGATPITLATVDGSADAGADAAADLLGGAPASETTAEWVELTLRSPGAEPVVVRRELFDRIGPARRNEGGITSVDLEPVELVEMPDGRDAVALPALNAHWITLATGLPSRDDPTLTITGDDPRAGAIVSEAYHLVGTAAATELATPAGFRPFVDAPNATAYSIVMHPSPEGLPTAETMLDLWHRSHGVVPVGTAAAATSPMVASGVLAHVAERIVGGEALPAADGRDANAPVSAGAIFDLAESEGVPWRVLREPGASATLGWEPNALARLESALDAGWVAIAPERAVSLGGRDRVGWWLVDPATGRTVDQLDDGRGGFADFLATMQVWYESLPAWIRIGVCIFTLARGMIAFLTWAMRLAEGKSVVSLGSMMSAGGTGSAIWSYRALGC